MKRDLNITRVVGGTFKDRSRAVPRGSTTIGRHLL